MLAIHDKKLKDAYAQQKKAYDLGMFCLKYGIGKIDLQKLAHKKLITEEKEREKRYDTRYD